MGDYTVNMVMILVEGVLIMEKVTRGYELFSKRLKMLEKSRKASPSTDFVIEATTYNFSLAFDLTLKVLKEVLNREFGIVDYFTGAPKELLKIAYENKLIDSEIWLKMLRDRNHLDATYDGELAQSLFEVIISDYYDAFVRFNNTISRYFC